jgi:hypothetical protein
MHALKAAVEQVRAYQCLQQELRRLGTWMRSIAESVSMLATPLPTCIIGVSGLELLVCEALSY